MFEIRKIEIRKIEIRVIEILGLIDWFLKIILGEDIAVPPVLYHDFWHVLEVS